ncbi:hypothetical protein JYQ62_25480 [Nostoc sp. UHCC 0702]|nr:hypothetical protein JYQ62_25480 [Nostoc sp. UHCC 0702]
MIFREWGLGTGDWGLGTGYWGLGNSGPPRPQGVGIRGNGDWGLGKVKA